MTVWHPHLRSRLNDFPIDKQLLLAGNELNRARNLKSDKTEYCNALERSMEILDMITDGTQPMTGSLRKELRRFREMIAQEYVNPTFHIDGLNRIFLQLNPKIWNVLGRDDQNA